MRIHWDGEGSVAGLEAILRDAGADARAGYGLLVLACDANGFEPGNVDGVLARASMPVFGGVFPAVLHGDRVQERGTVAVALPLASDVLRLPDFGAPGERLDGRIEALAGDRPPGRTMAVFLDGAERRAGAFIEGLFNVFGLEPSYVGGGAGSPSMRSKPCLFTNGGLRAGGAVIAPLAAASGVGVCHGWIPQGSPFQVTEARENEIRTLDWKPAFEAYADAVEAHGGARPHRDRFQQTANPWPFGIARLGGERIVRDPLAIGADGSLVCAGEVPEGSFVHLMHGDERSLIEAAGAALARARGSAPAVSRPGLHLLMDCISRYLFLGARFSEELAAVRGDGVPLVGACSIGEIANCGEEFLEFYNKTAVVAVLEDA